MLIHYLLNSPKTTSLFSHQKEDIKIEVDVELLYNFNTCINHPLDLGRNLN